MRHIKIEKQTMPISTDRGSATLELPEDAEILASQDRGKSITLVLGLPICGEETNAGSPCSRVVDTHDDTCHQHGDDDGE